MWTNALIVGLLATLTLAPSGAAESALRIGFDEPAAAPAFVNSWGDRPIGVVANSVVQDAGRAGPGARLDLQFGPDTPNKLSYWRLKLPEPLPIVPQLDEISVWVRTNVRVSLKVEISPFGFIYHGPGVGPAEGWQRIVLPRAYDELKAWCARGAKDVGVAFVSGVIIAVSAAPNLHARVDVDDVEASGPVGIAAAMRDEAARRRFRRVGVSVVTQPFSDQGRSLETVLDRLDEAASAGSDIVCLPMECVKTEGEPVPGPISDAIAERAARHHMYVIGNLREREGDQTYVTSFLCDRSGAIVGKYRKSHKLPDEDMDLGDDLPVFDTDFGPIAMRVGSDRYFADIDHVYTAKGARIIFWSQMPEPVEDEYLQDFPSAGRASDYNVVIACARYSYAADGWITSFFPPYRGCPIGRSYVINREGERIASTLRKGSVATALIPLSDLQAPGRGANHNPAFAPLTAPVSLPQPRQWSKRQVRVTCIENHVSPEDLLRKLDLAGEMGTDLAVTYELVWVPVHGDALTPEKQAELEAQARANLQRISERAARWKMYVAICGVIETREHNWAILYGRDGKEVGRYLKMARTYPEQILGTSTPILETDFGRLGFRICADQTYVELDRCYGVQGADIIVFATQDWGPDAIYRNLRDISRSMDAGAFHVQATHRSSEAMHRSMIVDPCGVPVARTQYLANGLVSAVLDLDNDRPRRYVRNWKPFAPGGYLPEYQSTEVPEVRNDLRETILAARRPELYQALAPETPKGPAN